MNSIFCHITPSKLPFKSNFNLDRYTFSKIPDYAQFSFDQCEKFLNKKSIIIDDEYIHTYMMDEIVDFYNLCKDKFPLYQSDAFWFTTLLRLFVVYDYSKRFKIDNFIHLEYDNLIYSNLECLKHLNPSIYFTRVGPYCSSAGFMYCNSLDNFSNFIDKIKHLITKGYDVVSKYTKYPTISEMVMIDLIYSNTKNIIDYLPILPKGVGDDNFDKLGVIFDGASYGQYISGTNAGDKSGWYGLHHYIGTMLKNGLIKIEFSNNKPYIIYENKSIDILNLHIHSKQLNKYI
jgi:hypothetical protein